MPLSEKEELELLELEEEEALASQQQEPVKDAVSDPTPEPVSEPAQEQGGFLGTIAKTLTEGPGDLTRAALSDGVFSALDAPIPGVGQAIGPAKEAMGKELSEAAKYYFEAGVPTIGKAVEAGGKFVIGAVPDRMKDALFVALAGPALKAAAIVGKPVARAGGNIIADIAGQIAGKHPEAVKAIYKKPGALWKKATELFGMKNQELLLQKISEGKAARGEQFHALEEVLTGFGSKSGGKASRADMRPVFKEVVREMERGGYHVPKSITGKNPIAIGRLPGESIEAKEIFAKLDTLNKNPNLEFGQALNLRRQIDRLINYGIEGKNGLQPTSTDANRILKLMRRRINTQMRGAVPKELRADWDRANFVYSQANKAYAELQKQVIRGDPGGTQKKLLQLLKDGRYDDEVLSRAEKLGEQTAKALEDVRDHIAAREFDQWFTSGLHKGAFGYFPTSPLLTGGVVAGAGEVAGAAGRVAGPVAGAVMRNPEASAMGAMGLRNLLNDNQ